MTKPYKIIDTHFHLGINPLIDFDDIKLEKWMIENNIDMQIIMQVNEGTVHRTPEWNKFIGNDWISHVQKKRPTKIIGLGGVNPWHQPPATYFRGAYEDLPFDKIKINPVLDELERIVIELELFGLKLHPLEHHHQINNPLIMNPIYEKLTDLQKKVNRQLILFVHAAGDSINNTPEAIYDAAKKYKDLIFIASHAGYKWAVATVAHTMARLDNVMLDLTTMAGPLYMRDCYKRYGAKKFCAGTDGPFASVGVKNAIVDSLTEDDEERALILGGNLQNLFNLH